MDLLWERKLLWNVQKGVIWGERADLACVSELFEVVCEGLVLIAVCCSEGWVVPSEALPFSAWRSLSWKLHVEVPGQFWIPECNG